MAWNWKTFKTRALSALLFVGIMFLGLLYNEWTFLVLFTFIHFGCWLEYQKIIALIDTDYASINPFHRYGAMLVGYGLMLFCTKDWFIPGTEVSLYSIGWILGLTGLFLLPVTEVLFSRSLQFKNIGYSLLGLVYISLSWALLLHIRSGAMWIPKNGNTILGGVSTILASISAYTIPLIIIASIWINDTMAYITGSLIGRRPLSPVSPKKTWEGTIGGIVCSVAIMSLIGFWSQSSAVHIWSFIALIASVSGTFGDLLESKLKRLAGIKDSGSILPGHGGFLDRFDSLLLATPFVWLFLKIID